MTSLIYFVNMMNYIVSSEIVKADFFFHVIS